MGEMNLAKELVKILPEEWGLWVGKDEISVSQFITSLRQDIHLDGERESPAFINWALDELAKNGLEPVLGESTEVPGCWWVSVETTNTEPGLYPTKTLALAHALIEVSRG